MKLYAEKLPEHLAKTLLPVYLISGDEALLVEEARQLIHQKAKQNGFSEIIKLAEGSGFDWEELLFITRKRSLLATKRLIEITISSGKPGQTGSNVLQQYASHPYDDIVLLILMPKLDSKTATANWFKAIDNVGATIATWPIESQQLPQWIKRQLAKIKLTTTPDAIQFIADSVEGNLLAAKQEIDKLHLTYGDGHLSLEDISHVISNQTHYDVFALVDNVLQGDLKRVVAIIENLHNEGMEPTIVLWALCRELRLIARLQFELGKGQNVATLLQKHKVWAKRQPLIKAALNKIAYEKALALIQFAGHIDRMIKGAEAGNSWNALQQLCLSFAGADQQQPLFGES